MESKGHCLRFLYAVLCILATILFTRCGKFSKDARLMVHIWKHQGSNLHEKLKITNHVGSSSNGDPYTLNSPFYLPPFDSLSTPLPQPDHSPPFTPQSPSNPPQPPASYGLPTPPPPSYIHSPPANPPETAPPEHGFSPPSIFPNPIQHQPSPPKQVPTPPKHVPGQPIKEPPVLNPPPRPPHKGSQSGAWCVAKPTVPDSLIQAAMDYACGSGADCKSIQPNQVCFQPNTLMAHASYAFNSYWQNKKGSGGTCDFGGTAMLVTVDPSFDKCQFRNN